MYDLVRRWTKLETRSVPDAVHDMIANDVFAKLGSFIGEEVLCNLHTFFECDWGMGLFALVIDK